MVLSALHSKECKIDFDLILKIFHLYYGGRFFIIKMCRKKSLRHNALKLLTIWGRRSMIGIWG